MGKDKILLHICCAPDATAVFERLQQHYEVVGFFHNPNIYPKTEYMKRLDQAHKVANVMGFELREGSRDDTQWHTWVKGLENEPEKGKRCEVCFQYNLDATAEYAAKQSIPAFTTTLTISPHKRIAALFSAGRRAAQKYHVDFLEIDFKKKDGFKRSLDISKTLSLYRQHYCGCEYSISGEEHA